MCNGNTCSPPRYPRHIALRSAPTVMYSENDFASPFERPSQFHSLSARDRSDWGPSIVHIHPRWSCGTVECHRSAEVHGVSKDEPEMVLEREVSVHECERTYTDGDGVVPSKVIPNVVILDSLDRLASAGGRWPELEEALWLKRRKEIRTRGWT